MLDYYTCKLAVCTTMESIVFRLRKTGLQKEPGFGNPISTIIRWTDRSGVPMWLRHFGPWSFRSVVTSDL